MNVLNSVANISVCHRFGVRSDCSFILCLNNTAKLRIIRELSKEYFKFVDFEDAAVADFATFAGGKQLDIAPTSVKIVSQGNTISQFEYRAVGFPHGNIDRVAGVEH